MALYTFYQVFRVVNNDTLEFINRTRVGRTTFEAGQAISRGQIIAGLNFFDFIGKNIEITDESDNTKNIERVFV